MLSYFHAKKKKCFTFFLHKVCNSNFNLMMLNLVLNSVYYEDGKKKKEKKGQKIVSLRRKDVPHFIVWLVWLSFARSSH